MIQPLCVGVKLNSNKQLSLKYSMETTDVNPLTKSLSDIDGFDIDIINVN